MVDIVEANYGLKKATEKLHYHMYCYPNSGGERVKNLDMLIFLFSGDGKFKTYCLALLSFCVSVQFSIRTCQPIQFHCFMVTWVEIGNYSIGIDPNLK